MEKSTTGLRPPGCQEHFSQMVGWREQKDIRVWSKKVLGLDVVVPESFARSERLVYLLICLMTPRERWGGSWPSTFGSSIRTGHCNGSLTVYSRLSAYRPKRSVSLSHAIESVRQAR